ncbi:MAG: flagellar protein FlgN [Candidatus Omnitrophota bacterium]
MNLQALIQILHKEQSLHEKMLLAKTDEQRCLALGAAIPLLGSAERLNDLAEETWELEKKRIALTQEIARSLNVTVEKPTLKDILDALPPEERGELEEARAALKKVIVRLQEANRMNAILLQRSTETFNREFAHLLQNRESGVYTQTGVRAKCKNGRGSLNLRA